ncbi:uncharacterized protein LOC127757381 [Oryza glaberrima]|uniref:uncharacterized protein LOC127757381 n=1 Tax=Oryza glaberrima TaxID=4538 RepID=UPI00023DF356|nr:uncharacterized protein LOC127757381 [Oryza glaberrima]
MEMQQPPDHVVEEHLSVRNATRAATAWVASPVGRLARIEVLVTLSCCLLAVLVLLGSGRRASHSAAFRLAVWSALMLSYPAVSYTIGLMQSASFRNELIVAWGCFLLLLLGCADGIAAYSLNDSNQQARTALNQGLQLVYVLILLVSYVGALPLQLRLLLLLLWALSAAKLAMRVRSFLSAGRDSVLTVENKLIADYMSREHVYGGPDYDAATMKGYRYVVAGEADQKDDNGDYHPIHQSNLDRSSIITVEKVWGCRGRLLNSDGDGHDTAASRRKDLCLSFAMFKLLRRRLGGYPLSEAPLNKTRDFVKVGLLAAGAGDDHERMYRVIEVELGFLFDFYYARYRSPRETLIPDTLVFAAVVVASLCTLFSPAVLNHRAASNSVTTGFDIWLTRIVIALFLILESFQYLTLVFSDWHKVKMLCRYVREPSWQNQPVLELMLKLMCRVRLIRYWNNSVGQYSLLLACLHSRCNACIWCLPLPKRMSRFLLRSRATRHRKLPEEVKRAIYLFLRSGLARVQHGEYALEKNGAPAVLYPRRQQEATTTSLILIWHIATELYDYTSQRRLVAGRAPAAADSGIVKRDRLVATTLSSYCAYLVSSAPELLPEHSYDTQLLLQGVQRKASECLGGCRSRDDMYDKLPATAPDSQARDVHRDILVEGRRLCEILGKMPETVNKWKLLAELWVELLLSGAPSDNAASHVQMLANGGELITHLWALLTHAGVIEKRTGTENSAFPV